MGQKNTFFQKQSGEVAENTGLGFKNKPEQTGKQSGEVVENTFLWKKQTGNKPKSRTLILLKLKDSEMRAEKRTGESSAPYCLHPVAASPSSGSWHG